MPAPEDLPTGSFSGEAEYLSLMCECWAQDTAARPTFAAIISRLRHMLALEASLRRDSPTKAPRAASGSLGLAGEEAALSRSRLATDSLISACASPLDARSTGEESLMSLDALSASPSLPAHRARSTMGNGSQLASIVAHDSVEAEAAAAEAAEAAAAAAAAAGVATAAAAGRMAAAEAAATASGVQGSTGRWQGAFTHRGAAGKADPFARLR